MIRENLAGPLVGSISMIFKNIKWNPLGSLQQVNEFNSFYHNAIHVIDPYKSSKLLSSYFKFGRIQDANELFEEIPEKNVVVWSIMIHGYAKNGFHRQSLNSFSRMRISGLMPNSYTIVGVLVSIAGLQELPLGLSMHGLIVKTGVESNIIVNTAMLDMYAKCGGVLDAYKIFKKMNNPCLVSSTAILTGFVYNELFEEALVLFNQFRKTGLIPDVSTVLTLSLACVAVASRRFSESIHGLVVKFGLNFAISINNSILDMYSSLMDLKAASKIFSGMEHKDVISWTTMMGLLIQLEHASDALKLFSKMRDCEENYDAIIVLSALSACADLGDLKRGRQIHAQAVIRCFDSELSLVNSMITMYSKCGDLDSSRIVFDQTPVKSMVSWTAMISGCIQNGKPREALNLLLRIRVEESFCPDSMMLASALNASGELAALEICQQLHSYAFRAGFHRYSSVQNSLISTYSKCGNAELAHNVFKEMGYLRGLVSWNALINGYGINGCGETAVACFYEMGKFGEDPDGATYLCVLSACSHSGLISDGLLIFNQMVKENKIRPSQQHFGCVVDLFARAGRLSDARKFVDRFLKEMGPDGWKALLGGCELHSNVGLAEVSARRVFEHDPKELDQFVLLSNLYASVGRFQDAEAVRLSMKMRALVKSPGISLLNGINYDVG